MRAMPSMVGRLNGLATQGRGRGRDAWQVFPSVRGLSMGDWQNLILCDYISSQLNQINFASKSF